MLRFALTPLLLLLCAATAAGQQDTFFVDPVNGSDANTGTANDPFQSITHVLGLGSLDAGDTIFLGSGVYNATNGIDGSGNQLETFPLTIPDGVTIEGESLISPAQIDGATTMGNVPTLLELGESVTQLTELVDIEFENCGTVFFSDAANSVAALRFDNCGFTNYGNYGINLELAGGRVDDAVFVQGCDFDTTSGTGVRLVVSDNTTLDDGAIEDCTFSGGLSAVLLETGLLGTIEDEFQVARNTIEEFSVVAIQLNAQTGSAQISATVRGNVIAGDNNNGTTETGISLLCGNTLGAGSPSVIDALISYNDVSQANVNLRLETASTLAGASRIESVFAGNLIRNGTDYAVRFFSAIDDGGMTPDFGGKVGGSPNAGRNTFDFEATGNDPEIGLDPDGDISGPIAMAFNFWPSGLNPQQRTNLFSQAVNYPTFSPILDNTLIGSLSRAVIQPNDPEVLTISLTNGRFVVHVDENFLPDVEAVIGSFGQYKKFEITGPDGTIVIDPADLQVVAINGTEISFSVPGLSEGNYNIQFTNPGFQQLVTIGLRVASGGGGGGDGGGGCVVATAAHGDYHAPEVRILRGFRDQYLLPHAPGRALVRGYYEHGEPLAVWIAERPWARKATRAALSVPTAFAWTLTEWNLGQRFLAGVLLLGASFWLLRRRS